MFDPDKMYTSFRIEVDKGEMSQAEADKVHEAIKAALASIDGISAVKMDRVGFFIKKLRGDENWDVYNAFKVRDLSQWKDHKPPTRPVVDHGKGIQIWEKGFVIQGNSSCARLLGFVDAPYTG